MIVPSDTDTIRFGKYKGEAYEDIPASYLLWLFAQDWLLNSYPDTYAYCSANQDILEIETVEEEPDYDA